MRIWKKEISPAILSTNHIDTATEHLGLEFLEVGDDFIRARVPVDKRTRQPYGLLHGGVSVRSISFLKTRSNTESVKCWRLSSKLSLKNSA